LKPLRVDAYLLDGRVATSDLYLPLDSMLAWAWIYEHDPERLAMSTSGFEGEIYHPPIPVERRESNGEWYYACSFAIGDPVAERTAWWNKRFDARHAEEYVDFQGRRGKINASAGRYKAYRMPVVTYLVPQLTWYCVGDEDEIRSLLANITHIGKKRSQGKGRVREWRVTPSDEDLSHLRPIPDPDGHDWQAVRPPYWEHRNVVQVSWPEGSEILSCRRPLRKEVI
jgi:CRISPR type IV-associated protein Csf3